MSKKRNQMKNKYQKKKNREIKKTLAVLLQTIKDQSKRNIQNGSSQSTTRGRAYKRIIRWWDLQQWDLCYDTTEEEILALLGLGGTTYSRENIMTRRQCTQELQDFLRVYIWGFPNRLYKKILEVSGIKFKTETLSFKQLQKWWITSES